MRIKDQVFSWLIFYNMQWSSRSLLPPLWYNNPHPTTLWDSQLFFDIHSRHIKIFLDPPPTFSSTHVILWTYSILQNEFVNYILSEVPGLTLTVRMLLPWISEGLGVTLTHPSIAGFREGCHQLTSLISSVSEARMSSEPHHATACLKIFVVVIPNEGSGGVASHSFF